MKLSSRALVLLLTITQAAYAFDATKTEELLIFMASLGNILDLPHKRLIHTDNKPQDKLRELVEEGGDPNAQNGILGLRAMSFTIDAGDLETTRYLIEQGAEIISEMSYRDSLSIACNCSDFAMLTMLIGYGASINRIRGSSYALSENIKALINSWRDVNINIPEESMLHKALRRDFDESIEAIIRGTQAEERSALLNHKDFFGQTPLDMACILRKPKAIEILLKYGAHPLDCHHNCVQLASRAPELPKEALNLLIEKTKEGYALILMPIFKKSLTKDLVLLIIDIVVKSYMPRCKEEIPQIIIK